MSNINNAVQDTVTEVGTKVATDYVTSYQAKLESKCCGVRWKHPFTWAIVGASVATFYCVIWTIFSIFHGWEFVETNVWGLVMGSATFLLAWFCCLKCCQCSHKCYNKTFKFFTNGFFRGPAFVLVGTFGLLFQQNAFRIHLATPGNKTYTFNAGTTVAYIVMILAGVFFIVSQILVMVWGIDAYDNVDGKGGDAYAEPSENKRATTYMQEENLSNNQDNAFANNDQDNAFANNDQDNAFANNDQDNASGNIGQENAFANNDKDDNPFASNNQSGEYNPFA